MKYAKMCFGPGVDHFRTPLSMVRLMGDLDNDQGQMDRSKTNKTRIPITSDVNGEPEIPSATIADGYHTKVMQGALREYCTAHIRE
jgi:hypothetical protein